MASQTLTLGTQASPINFDSPSVEIVIKVS